MSATFDAAADPATVTSAPRRRLRLTLGVRLAILVVLTIVAFRYSLSTLIASLTVDSPLAYLGLVPFLALGLGVALARPRTGEPEVHDRYLDRILGVPLITVALLVLMVLPAQMSTFFWLWRVDLLALPLFVAGLAVWLFGSRMLIRVGPAIAFLFAAWPVPFRLLLARFLDGFTSLSAEAIERIVVVVPVARATSGPGGAGAAGFFTIASPAGGSFDVLIATECSGANGLLGFILVSGALMLVAHGSWRRKLTWLAFGSVVVWVFNLARIFSIFVVGRFWGEGFAIDGFHPYVGLVTFSLATLFAVWFLPRFGITFGGGRRSWSDLDGSVRLAVPSVRLCVVGLVAAALVAGTFNADLQRVNPVASALGAPQVIPFGDLGEPAPGYDSQVIDRFEWAKRFFGEESDWTRYQLSGGGTAELGGDLPVLADVVTTPQLELFNDFGVEACYRFHGYGVEGVDEVDLGRGQIGTMLAWQDPAAELKWTALFWFWPIAPTDRSDDPQPQQYQRVVLLLNSSTDAELWSPEDAGRPTAEVGMSLDRALKGRRDADRLSPRDEELRAFLLSMGREVVAASAPEEES